MSRKTFLVTLSLSWCAGLAACQGDSTAVEASALPVSLPPLSLPEAPCVAVPGPFDAAQQAILDGLRTAAQLTSGQEGVPTQFTLGLIAIFDAPDALLAALQNLAANQNPAAFAAEVAAAGAALGCTNASINIALAGLRGQLALSAPQDPQLQSLLDQIGTQQVQLDRTLASGGDARELARELRLLGSSLSQLEALLPAALRSPSTGIALGLLSAGLGHIGNLLVAMSDLDADATAEALGNMALGLSGAAAAYVGFGPTGLPSYLVLPTVGALLGAADDVRTQAEPYLGPLYAALDQALAGQTDPAVFAEILGSALTQTPSADLLALLGGGGLTSTGMPVPLLTDLLAQLLPGGVSI